MVVRVTGSASRGPAGKDGAAGAAGAPGVNGKDGASGAAGPAGTPKRVERYTANTNASGIATFTFPAFAAAPDIDVVQTWVGDQMAGGGVTAQTLTGCTVLAKISRATLLLSAGPFQTAGAGVPVTIRVIGS